MLFYSRYQSNDPEDFSTQLTMMQASMTQGKGYAIYRKPYVYELPSDVSYKQFTTALYRTVSSHAPLQIKLIYHPKQQRYIQRVHPLPPLQQWDVPIIDIHIQPEIYIVTEERSIELSKDYPWRVKYLQFNGKRYFYIEFHGICMDDYGVKCFEESLFKALVSSYQPPSGNLSSFRLLLNTEIISKSNKLKFFAFANTAASKQRYEKMVAVPYQLNAKQLEVVNGIARQYKVDLQVVFQLIIEQTLGDYHEGQVYGVIDNFRYTLRNFDETGCFTYMNEELIQGLHAMRCRLIALQLKRQNRKEGELSSIKPSEAFFVVYSYEEVLCQHMIEVPADQYSYHDLCIRVRHGIHSTTVRFEYRQSQYTREQSFHLMQRMVSTIDLLRQQLLVHCAS